MGHESEHPAANIAYPGNVALGAVRVDRVRPRFANKINITQDNLARLLQSLQNPGLPDNEIPFAVRHGHLESLVTFQEWTFAWGRLQSDPTIFELARRIMRQGRQRAFIVGRNEETGLQDGLESIADAEDEFVGVTKALQALTQEVRQLVRQDFPGGHVVAIGKTAGHHQNLKTLKQARLLAKAIDVQPLRNGACLLESELGLHIAVGPGRSKYQCTR